VIERLDSHEHLATADVSDVGRTIIIGLLEDEELQPGDWVLIHVGFAPVEDRRASGGAGPCLVATHDQPYDDELKAGKFIAIVPPDAASGGRDMPHER
jgi:hydrogenase expression/formation protein HypC